VINDSEKANLTRFVFLLWQLPYFYCWCKSLSVVMARVRALSSSLSMGTKTCWWWLFKCWE